MSKADARRDQIVERLADHLLAEGLAAASLRPLGGAAGTSDRMLLYYFRDKDALMAATLTRVAERLTGLLDAAMDASRHSPEELERRLMQVVVNEAIWPFMCLWVELAASAVRGNAVYRAVGLGIAHGFRQWIADRLDITDPTARDAAALRLMATVDGALLLHGIGVPGVIAPA